MLTEAWWYVPEHNFEPSFFSLWIFPLTIDIHGSSLTRRARSDLWLKNKTNQNKRREEKIYIYTHTHIVMNSLDSCRFQMRGSGLRLEPISSRLYQHRTWFPGGGGPMYHQEGRKGTGVSGQPHARILSYADSYVNSFNQGSQIQKQSLREMLWYWNIYGWNDMLSGFPSKLSRGGYR